MRQGSYRSRRETILDGEVAPLITRKVLTGQASSRASKASAAAVAKPRSARARTHAS